MKTNENSEKQFPQHSQLLSAYLPPLSSHLKHPCMFSMLLQYQSVSVPWVHTTFASRSFRIAAPSVWNSLPSDTCVRSSSHAFRHLLKTHCFDQTFRRPVSQIRPLLNNVHFTGFIYLLTYTCMLQMIACLQSIRC